MRLRLLVPAVILALLAAACQGPPPTVYVLVVTATPSGTPEGATAVSASPEANTPEATLAPPTITPSPTVSPSPTFDPFPTTTVSQVQVAEERFQHGRMIWLRPIEQIWVMVDDGSGTGGVWRIYDDTFVDGDVESDPSIVPPEGLFQPIRGFGKVWRENPDVREALGWAIEPESGYVTQYEYHDGGYVSQDNVYVRGPGYHIVVGLYGETYKFDEATGTWSITSP